MHHFPRIMFSSLTKNTVSGFIGWAQPLLGAINYFGGFEDLALILSQQGYIVFVVPIGPISSDIERACQIFTQLTNISNGEGYDVPGQPRHQGIAVRHMFGTSHPSVALQGSVDPITPRAILYQAEENRLRPEWKWSEENKLSFICHSQGGTAVRCLIALLSGETQVHPDLVQFHGTNRQSWIKSVATLGTPHKGSTVTDAFEELFPRNPTDMRQLDLLVDFIASASFQPRSLRSYDLQLDHWGFHRLDHQETYLEMRDRIRPAVTSWYMGNNNALYVNSLEGAKDLLAMEQRAHGQSTSPGIYYFTLSFCATIPFPEVSLTAEDISSFMDLFKLSLLNPFDITATVLQGVTQRIMDSRLFPPLHATSAWAVRVANRHLGRLGYFSQIPIPGNQVPRPDMLDLIKIFGYAIGGRTIEDGTFPGISSDDFQANDGIVNTLSMDGPNSPGEIGDADTFADVYSADPATAKGKYWHMGLSETIDHADEIGVFTNPSTNLEVQAMYLLLSELGNRLE